MATTIATKAYQDQKPGTSGLRKKVTVFQQEHYLANFVQATINSLPESEVKGKILVVGGDGRYFVKEAVQTIIKIAAGNGYKHLWIGQNGLLSTPAVSAIVRNRRAADGSKASGAFILTASHNPGGPTEDFGIKYNCANGGPAPEKVTEAIYTNTTTITSYLVRSDIPEIDLATVGSHTFGDFTVEVIDSTEDYVALLQTVFDFSALRALLHRKDFTFVYDCMNGVAGPYVNKIFVEILGAKATSVMNGKPLEDFGHLHPDPNLTYAPQLVATMGLDRTGEKLKTLRAPPDFGAAADGDADRNMILGRHFFVTPSDSVAVLAANAKCIPFFKDGLNAVARSMPTSAALDRVANKLGIKCFEVPTGWKFFGNLMDSKELYNGTEYTPLICGEESFGTGSNHVREKDGVWAVLAWLSILAEHNRDESQHFVSVETIMRRHWAEYGRNYYCRYDYEGVSSESAETMMNRMRDIDPATVPLLDGKYKIATKDDFMYVDPVDASVSKKQGIRFIYEDGSRFVFRLSGTGSSGATIRLYLEKYVAPDGDLSQKVSVALNSLVTLALQVSDLAAITGRDEPTVIT